MNPIRQIHGSEEATRDRCFTIVTYDKLNEENASSPHTNHHAPWTTQNISKFFEKTKTIPTFAAPFNAGKTLKQSKIMQQYETVIILTPLLSEEIAKEAIAKYSKFLKDNGAEIVQEDNWGLRKLAYPIQKKNTGYYHLTEYKAPGELINKLEIEFKRDERVLRFLTIALDKHAIAYNEKKRSGAFNQKKTAKAEEAAK